ncbi:imidazoleglycerol-phosphate dehydratase HisB [Desulforhabdus amnigena]|jgi:imidazoleglycerol-phosphate dehydratase|uniref:Imidazoleglycerol-phosphate dehydratase n=1 Tax=Desulforhabdus amnigena TaxID=40218 RepID=A0A9W6FTX3_9BACT|nr:imidazoleglycerol-phosphate dehydratase HisB [Desulforhabdus amnigena]NLJ28070.1 imidazoleglycerol-phosphate dehydratase HisB [Deltaproteobacteria bacterium]GLI34596.1 imidazoleglycerol-phosphate dehydratase [Desulforhabdus amnigena]
MTGKLRRGTIDRRTKETQIQLDLVLDGKGSVDLKTGVPFLDHMLTLFSVHGLFDLKIQAVGDLEIDAHHTVEDLGICLGDALSSALGDRKGICRYGHAIVPMDETCASVVMDLSNRPYLVYQVPPLSERVGQFETELVPEFLRAFCQHGGVTLHIQVPYGKNTHHILEAIFKALGRALDQATRMDERRSGVPSSKGAL